MEVELTTGEGAVSVSWLAIQKVVSLGDFIEVTGGVFCGRMGWIKAIDGEVVGIVRDLDGQKPITLDNIRVSQILNVIPLVLIFSSGVRCHRQFSKAYLGTLLTWVQPPLLNDVPWSDKVPWIKTEIMIVKTGSLMRTFADVVQLTILEAVGPFRRVILDYDDVMEVCGFEPDELLLTTQPQQPWV